MWGLSGLSTSFSYLPQRPSTPTEAPVTGLGVRYTSNHSDLAFFFFFADECLSPTDPLTPFCHPVHAELIHLMQFFGSSSQSTLQRKRSQASQPMGGVRRSPFSSISTRATRANKSTEGWRGTVTCKWLLQLYLTLPATTSPGPAQEG